ncbi:hypothetical protein [Nonomuraea solani]|nr:hypothetical protein [Nonomuraea solani]
MAGVLTLVGAFGVVWLVGVATGGGDGRLTGAPGGTSEDVRPGATGEEPGEQATDGAEQGSDGGQGSDGEQGSRGGQGRSGRSPGSSGNGRQSVTWNGIHLDGSGGGGCMKVINKTSTPGVIESVSFLVESGPGKATVRSGAGHCERDGDPSCQGVMLRPGTQCIAGAQVSGPASETAYVLRAQVRYRYVCVDPEDSPCDEVGDWKGPPPTAERPITISGTTDDVPPMSVSIEGPSSPDEESPSPSPDDAEQPDTSATDEESSNSDAPAESAAPAPEE